MSRFMRVLEKAGLVQLDEREADAAPPPTDEAEANPAPPPAPTSAGPAGEAISAAAGDAALAVTEQRPFADIYVEHSVAVSPFPAEKLLKILDGLAALEPPARKAAVLALDAADDAWSIDDALLDAQSKVKALQTAKLAVEDQARGALVQARARIEQREQRQQDAVATIRKQVNDLEALLEREVTRATEEKAALTHAAHAAKEACQRETARFEVEIERLRRIEAVFAPAAGTLPAAGAAPTGGAARRS